jgi:hypothetical protein
VVGNDSLTYAELRDAAAIERLTSAVTPAPRERARGGPPMIVDSYPPDYGGFLSTLMPAAAFAITTV